MPHEKRRRLPRLRRFVAARLDRRSELGLRVTANVLVFVLAVWALSGLLEEVLDQQGLVRWDHAVEQWFHLHATTTGSAAFSVVTRFGSEVVYVLMAVVALLLWARREHDLLWAWVGANVGGKIIEFAMKMLVHRSRPEYAALALDHVSYSFPSGHAMGSTVCYLMLAYVISSLGRWPPAGRIASYAAAVVIILLVTYSRLYLAVHFPSDVFGGILAGIAWLAATFTALRVARGWRSAAAPAADADR